MEPLQFVDLAFQPISRRLLFEQSPNLLSHYGSAAVPADVVSWLGSQAPFAPDRGLGFRRALQQALVGLPEPMLDLARKFSATFAHVDQLQLLALVQRLAPGVRSPVQICSNEADRCMVRLSADVRIDLPGWELCRVLYRDFLDDHPDVDPVFAEVPIKLAASVALATSHCHSALMTIAAAEAFSAPVMAQSPGVWSAGAEAGAEAVAAPAVKRARLTGSLDAELSAAESWSSSSAAPAASSSSTPSSSSFAYSSEGGHSSSTSSSGAGGRAPSQSPAAADLGESSALHDLSLRLLIVVWARLWVVWALVK